MNVWRQTGHKPKELENLSTIPQSCYETWGWFLQLNESRSSNGFGFDPISYGDIDAFFRLQQIIPELWEIDLIRRLDRTVLSVYSAKQKADSKKSNKK
jgi:hypothetical protein